MSLDLGMSPEAFALTIVIGVVGSIVATWILARNQFNKSEKPVEEYRSNLARFESEITYWLIEDVIKKLSPEVYARLQLIGKSGLRAPYFDFDLRQLQFDKDLEPKPHIGWPANGAMIDWKRNNLGQKVFNGDTFRLAQLMPSNKVKLGISDYYSTLSTSDIHFHNIVRSFPRKFNRFSAWVFRNRITTRAWIQSLEQVVLHKKFDHYAASIGGSVLTVVKNSSSDGKYAYLYVQNSTEKASAGGAKHVVPAFMMGPLANDSRKTFSEHDIKREIARKFGEELLGMPECKNPTSVEQLMAIINGNDILRQIFSSNANNLNYQVHYAGLVLDIFRMRPELLYVVLINDEHGKAGFKPNWQWSAENVRTDDGALLNFPSVFDDDELKSLLDYRKSKLCPPAVAAIAIGVEKVRKIIKSHRSPTD